MKKLIASLLVLSTAAACRSSTSTRTVTSAAPVVNGNQTGAADPGAALRGFLAAAKQQDLQAMAALWGDRDGSARGRIPRVTLEQREIIMASCLRHDRYDILGDAPATGGGRTFVVNLLKPGKVAAVNFDVVPATDSRWYVQKFELEKLMNDYCKAR
jgi:hypothetical protein